MRQYQRTEGVPTIALLELYLGFVKRIGGHSKWKSWDDHLPERKTLDADPLPEGVRSNQDRATALLKCP